MIKTTGMLIEELKEYTNPSAKIRRLVDSGLLFPIVRGIYETDRTIPGYYLASIIYGPSYLSFEYALSYYSIIPESAYNFTSATFEKKKKKKYSTLFGTFFYQDVPSEVYPLGIVLRVENGYGYQIASPEKAICDMLYKVSPVSNRQELLHLLFDDLRIDRESFFKLNMDELIEIGSYYQTQNHKLLVKYIQRRLKNESDH